MKKKLALLLAAIMTVAMVPMTAFASTKLTAVDEISTSAGDEHPFTSRVELSKNDDQVDVEGKVVSGKYGDREVFEVILKLENGKFAKNEKTDKYVMEEATYGKNGVWAVDVKNDTTAYVTLDAAVFNGDQAGEEACVLDIEAYAVETGDVVAAFTSNVTQFKKASEVIATAYDNEVAIEIEGVRTFVEDATKDQDTLKDITINGLVNDAIDGNKEITLKLSGNFEFVTSTIEESDFSFLNSDATVKITDKDKDTIKFTINGLEKDQLTKLTISGIDIKTTKKCNAGDKATITVSSKSFDSVKLEAARMVEEAVTYTVEDEEVPTIWAGKNYAADSEDDTNTLEVAIEENTGDILNTSRKATFTFPEGIEVVDIDVDGVKKDGDYKFKYEIDENVVTVWNYGEKEESDETDMQVKFLLNAAPTFSGDVKVTLGGEFDDVELKVATVKAPYTVEAKTTEVLIDYRYVPVNEIVITEAEEGLLEDGDVIALQVEKMDFEDAGSYEVTTGDLDVDVTINDGKNDVAQLEVEVKDESTEASTVTISGLELYLDRTLPVGGYALQNVKADNILWENSTDKKGEDDKDSYEYVPEANQASNGLFKYKEVTCNENYVEVVTSGRDNDDSTTNRKIVITIGATTMAVGT
ncbi:MAG: hypothetical protein KH033_05565, partial [Clostridiales bacterium]|nr:hypothetical protein [Clostridiales bacterium]